MEKEEVERRWRMKSQGEERQRKEVGEAEEERRGKERK